LTIKWKEIWLKNVLVMCVMRKWSTLV